MEAPAYLRTPGYAPADCPVVYMFTFHVQRQIHTASQVSAHTVNCHQKQSVCTRVQQIGTSRGQQFKPPPTGSFHGQGGDRVAHKDSGLGHLGEGLSQGRGQPR